jgi:uncharacterized protein (UPF0332 family)
MKESPSELAQKEPLDIDEEAATRAASEILSWVQSGYIEPEIQRRKEQDWWPEGTILYRFQVQFPETGSPNVLLNDEVQGILEVKASGPIEKGQLITEQDFSEISDYRPLDEDAGTPHVTGFAHGGSWFLGFQLAQRHPARREHLEAGQEFLATAQYAFEQGRLRVALDAANSAAELLAKAELLSCGPAIELAEKAHSHDGVSTIYNLWGRLGNTEPEFVDALNRLRWLRSRARYLKGDSLPELSQIENLLETLEAMEDHAAHLVKAPLHDLPPKYTVIATRKLKAGELIGPEASTIFPRRRD